MSLGAAKSTGIEPRKKKQPADARQECRSSVDELGLQRSATQHREDWVSAHQLIQVKVRPNTRQASLELQPDGVWLACLRSPPVDGKANAELISLVAKQFKCARSKVSIKAGNASRTKLVKIEAD